MNNVLATVLAKLSSPFDVVGRSVIAKRKIEQSPLDDSPAVPRGTEGVVSDIDSGYLFVDFDEPWGVVVCDVDEIELAH